LGKHCPDVLYYYHSDHIGSSTFLTDALGIPYEFMLYLPFGEAMAQQKVAGWATPYTFTGKEQDAATGLHYFGARYLDTRLSMWFGVDPLADAAPGWTPYRYGFNNPVRYTDPTGLFEDDPIYDSKGNEIGDDGKTDGKAYVVQGSVARDVKKATKAGRFYTGSLTEGKNVVKVPTGGVMEDVISSVEATESSQREQGGHSMFGDVNAILWDEGPEAELTVDADGTKILKASIRPFRVEGKRVNVKAQNVEFWWHTHPKTEAGGLQLGSSNPTGADFSFQGSMQGAGFKGNTFVIGVRDQKVSFYNQNKVVLRMNYQVFKQIGKK